VILDSIFAVLALLSLGLTIWQWLAARRFPLHQRDRSAELRFGAKAGQTAGNRPNRSSTLQPGVTLLKPLKGCEEHTASCLRSWFTQDYAGELQILFGVGSAEDPACDVVKKLLAEFPEHDAKLVFCLEQPGPNEKVSKLAQLEPLAKHELVVISDADVRVPPDLLANLVAPLNDETGGDAFHRVPNFIPRAGDAVERVPTKRNGATGLVNCFYQLANPTTLAMRWEAIAVNADFWSQVLQSASFRKLDFALGAAIATRRKHLAEIGGFKALVDYLADDYQLGRRLTKRGHRVALCPVVAECWSAPMDWGEVWKHQLRWARTIRVCQPVPYFFSILNNVTIWSLAWVVAGTFAPIIESHTVTPNVVSAVFVLPFAWFGAAACLFIRVIAALDLQSRLTLSVAHWNYCWLVPVKDLLQFVLWAGAFLGNRIEWRGQRYRLRRDGTLLPQ